MVHYVYTCIEENLLDYVYIYNTYHILPLQSHQQDREREAAPAVCVKYMSHSTCLVMNQVTTLTCCELITYMKDYFIPITVMSVH